MQLQADKKPFLWAKREDAFVTVYIKHEDVRYKSR